MSATAKPFRWINRAVAALLATIVLHAFVPLSQAEPVDEPAYRVAKQMGRGINILGYDGLWQGHLRAPFRTENFAAIYKAGFRHVRINLHAFQHMDAQGRLDPKIYGRLEWAFDNALAAGLMVVVDEHDFSDCQSDVKGCAQKLRSFWQQISKRFAGKYPGVIFELLNEPGGQMTTAEWNEIHQTLLSDIRQEHKDRIVIIAALNVEDGSTISELKLPENDRNLIVTVHYYRPFEFTHQGAPWVFPGTRVEWGTDSDKAVMTKDLKKVADWGVQARRPIYLGEFGVYDTTPPVYRTAYLSFITRLSESYGWPWAYWQFDHDFAAFDSATQKWNETVLNALIPGSAASPAAP